MNTHEKLQKILNYDPTTGVMTWTAYSGIVKRNGIAGYAKKKRKNHLGYWKIEINGREYSRSKLAWFHYYGALPTKALDHINGNSLDDRIVNLREATNAENCRNRGPQINNTSGYKGVHLNEGKWRAKIGNTVLGRFNTPEEAAAVYQAAALQLHGKFAKF
jgi:hypothetical protein